MWSGVCAQISLHSLKPVQSHKSIQMIRPLQIHQLQNNMSTEALHNTLGGIS